MKKIVLLLAIAISTTALFAQEKEGPKDGWTKKGKKIFKF